MFLFLVFLMLSRLSIAALWSPAGKGLTSWLLLVILIINFLCLNKQNVKRCFMIYIPHSENVYTLLDILKTVA